MWWFALTLIALPLQIFYTLCMVIIDNQSDLTGGTIVVQLVVLTLLILFLLIMLELHTRVYVIHSDRLEIRHFLGLSNRSYGFNDLKIAFYNWTPKTALLELPNGRQLTLLKTQYTNYDEIAVTLKQRIQNNKLKFKFVNRLTVFVVVAILIVLFLTTLQPGKN